MGCCSSSDVPEEIKTDNTSTTPERKRQCTDVVFLIVFIAALAGAGFLAYRSSQTGDPARFVYGVDSWGNVCGRKINSKIYRNSAGQTQEASGLVKNSGLDRSEHSYEINLMLSDISFITNPAQALSNGNSYAILCVNACPNATATNCNDLLSQNGYDVDTDVITRRICQMPGGQVFAHDAIVNRCVPKLLSTLGKGVAQASVAAASALSDAQAANSTELGTASKNYARIAHGIVLSVNQNWTKIVYLLLIAVVASLGIIILLQLFTRVLLIIIVIVAGLGTAAVTGYLWYTYLVSINVISKVSSLAGLTAVAEGMLGMQNNATTDVTALTGNLSQILNLQNLENSNYLLPITIVATAVTLISWTVLIWSRKSLKLVVALFDEASLAIFSMPMIIVQPVWTVIWLSFAAVGFLVIGAYLLSDQVPLVDQDGFVSFVDKLGIHSGRIMLLPVVLIFLWIFEFMFACQEIILAGAVSSWFFSRQDGKKCSCKPLALLRPTLDLLMYNLGTAAFGSLIVAIVQFIRILLAYAQKKMKSVDNKAAKFCLKCMQCCLACFEKVLKYINRNAYICVAMYGEGFCSSAKKALALLISNAQHVLALNCVSGFCLFLGKIAVAAIVGVIGWFWLPGSGLAFIVPMLISCLGAFFVASCFMSVFGMAIDTIFLCFCDDVQRNDGGDRPYYSSKSLQKFMSHADRKKSYGQPKTSARTATQSASSSKKAKRQGRGKIKPSSFTRIHILDRESYQKSFGGARVQPLPGFG